MSDPFIDTNVLVRLITGDDLAKQAAARVLFRQVQAGVLTLRAPATVIADTVFVLASRKLYNLSRGDIRTGLVPLLRLPGFKVQDRRVLLRALDIFAATNLAFGDAMIVATMERSAATVLYSYDHGFDRVHGIARIEP